MSQHSVDSIPSNPSTITATAESSDKSDSSASGSLKNLKNKDAEVPITDDFVLMSTPDKFKDKNISDTNAAKRYRSDYSPNDKINLECLLLSDTSEQCGAPQHVQKLLRHYANTQPSQAEILFLLVYVVALESGYIGHADYEHAKYHIDHLTATSSFHAKNILYLSSLKPSYKAAAPDKTRFTLKLCTLIDVEDVCSDYLQALLTGFVTGDLLIVSLSPTNSTGAKGFCTSLSIGRYVLSMQTKNKPLYQRFCKLNELSYILREQLFVPMRCQQLGWLEYCCVYPSLDGIPAELYDHILKYLSKNQLRILANVNKSLYNLTKSSKFMKQSSTTSFSSLEQI